MLCPGTGEPLDRRDALACRAAHWRLAAANSLAIEVYGAGSAETLAASEFSAGELQLISQEPEQRHLRITIELRRFAIDYELMIFRVSADYLTMFGTCFSIPKGCKKVARGKRSAAPGMLSEEALRPEGARDRFAINQRLGSGVLSGRGSLFAHSRGCASLAPGYLLASLRDAQTRDA